MNGKDRVRAKKFLGQHFLKDEAVARDIVDALHLPEGLSTVLEIGPGMGVLTSHLLQKKGVSLHAVELDRESVAYLITHFPELQGRLIEGDFLQLDLKALLPEPFAIIGNFPYNISTQILFRVLEHRDHTVTIYLVLNYVHLHSMKHPLYRNNGAKSPPVPQTCLENKSRLMHQYFKLC